jgi:hypothetical protein
MRAGQWLETTAGIVGGFQEAAGRDEVGVPSVVPGGSQHRDGYQVSVGKSLPEVFRLCGRWRPHADRVGGWEVGGSGGTFAGLTGVRHRHLPAAG